MGSSQEQLPWPLGSTPSKQWGFVRGEALGARREAGLGGPCDGSRLAPATDKRNRARGVKRSLWAEPGRNSWRRSRAGPTAPHPRTGSLAGSKGEPRPENAARERSRVRTLRQAFRTLQAALPTVPPDTKLSKLDILVLATSYIAHLTHALRQEPPDPAGPPLRRGPQYLHPMKKWPMRSRLYGGALGTLGLDLPVVTASGQRQWGPEDGLQVCGELMEVVPPRTISPALSCK
ncbi:transcription factor 23 [Tachyglossus aculeatus]|uniref:transcription factor 23 n=1 Tax=Tachyglossus aculeatus TaxID=9261 RepID=UPI0018F28AFF|nr:transcription factor 23 [Tachyglossus aculeatus]